MAETRDAVTNPSADWYETHQTTHADGELQLGFRLTKDEWSEAKLEIEKHAAGIKQGKNYKGNKGPIIRKDARKLVALVPALGSAPDDWLVAVTPHLLTSAISRVGRRQKRTDQPSPAPGATASRDATGGEAPTSNPDGGSYGSPSLGRTASVGPQTRTQAAPLPIDDMFLSVHYLSRDLPAILELPDIVNNKGLITAEWFHKELAGKRFEVVTPEGKRVALEACAFLNDQIRQHAAACSEKVVLVEY